MQNVILYLGLAVLSVVAMILLVYLIKKLLQFLFYVHDKFTYWDTQNEWLATEFRRCNVIVFGKKGSGKDVLFNHVINLIGDVHYGNMPYNDLTIVQGLETLSVGGNTFRDFMENTLTKFEPLFEEGKNYYISDAGIYLSSQYYPELDKEYASMPVFFALSRQLHNMCIHANVQYIGRLWNKLKEQGDCYIWVRNTKLVDDCLIVTAISYDRYASAEKMLLPSADAQHQATHGEIVERKFKVPLDSLAFDTRYFRSILLDIDEKIYSRLEVINARKYRR